MARPKTYARRIDTKVRIRQDHREMIDRHMEANPGITRNAVIEAALDVFFQTKRPRLAKPDPSQAIGQAAVPSSVKHRPQVAQVGRGIEEVVRDRQPAPNVVPPRSKTRVAPRTRRI